MGPWGLSRNVGVPGVLGPSGPGASCTVENRLRINIILTHEAQREDFPHGVYVLREDFPHEVYVLLSIEA